MVGGWLDGWMEGWMGAWMDEWMDKWGVGGGDDCWLDGQKLCNKLGAQWLENC